MWKFLGAWCLAALLLPGAAAAAEPVCEVVALLGEARLGENGRMLALGDRLEAGAEVRTGRSGRLRLRFGDGSTLVVSDGSVLVIERYEQPAGQGRQARFLLELGLIGQKVMPGGSWEVRTPTAVTAVRGTEFIVEVARNLDTAVNVQSGNVSVEAVQVSPGGLTRSLRPRSMVALDSAEAGTQCNPDTGCSQVVTWSAARVKRAQDLLSGV